MDGGRRPYARMKEWLEARITWLAQMPAVYTVFSTYDLRCDEGEEKENA